MIKTRGSYIRDEERTCSKGLGVREGNTEHDGSSRVTFVIFNTRV